MMDPLVLVAITEQSLDALGDLTACRQPGCGAPAAPDGPPFTMGDTVPGSDVVIMRKIRCVAGHWYMEEVVE